MRRQTRKITKRVLSLLLVIFLISINSFAAVVSDNDGSAFITKAEFDSLKSNFQSQIDQYNTSIDSKIDGAIASYLSGMSLTAQETLKTVLTKDQKIKNLKDATEVAYKKGLSRDNGILMTNTRGWQATGNANRAWMWMVELVINLKTSSNEDDYKFKKTYINNIDDDKKIGNFYGYYEDEEETIKCFAGTAGSYPMGKMSIETDLSLYSETPGFFKWKTTGKTFDGAELFLSNSIALGKGGYGIVNSLEFGVAFFNRKNGTKSFECISIPKSIAYNRFTDYDRQAYNYANDDAINGDTQYNAYDKVIDSMTLISRQQQDKDTARNDTVGATFDFTVDGQNQAFIPPYEGFANTTLTNWNQIYNSVFDSVATYYNSGVTTDSNGVKHLMSYAGLPLCEIKRGNKLEYQLKWDGDTTKEYDVWVKMSPFGDKIPDDETGLETEIVGARGGTYIERGANKYLTLKTGDRIILNAASADGYVFIKWREKGDASYGGGTLISTGEALMTKEA